MNELMEKTEQKMTSSDIAELMKALAKAQSEIEGAREDSDNPYFKSKYADLSSVWRACRDPLTKNGLSVVQVLDTINDKPCIVTLLGHASGQWIKGVFMLPQTKGDAQSVGSAITYIRRYALSAIVGVSPIDDDGEKAMSGMREKDHQKIVEKDFKALAPSIGNLDDVLEYTREIAENTNKSELQIMEAAIKAPERFAAAYKLWVKKNFLPENAEVNKAEG